MSVDLTTTTESVAAETQRRTTRKNLTSNAVIFYVRVLTTPLPYDQEDANVILKQGWIEPPSREPGSKYFSTNTSASDGKSTADKNPKIMFRGRILQSNNGLRPHILLRDPCKVGLGRNLSFIYKLLQKHTLFISKDGFFGHTPRIGDVVQVSLPPSDFDGPDLQVSFFDSIVDKSSANEFGDYLSRVNCESLKDKMSRGLDFDGSATKLSSLGAAIRLQSFIDTTQEVEANKILKGTSFPKLTDITDTELNLWGPLTPPQKVESDPEMYKVLKKYWDNLNRPESKWSPAGVPWSAAFVSYLMNQVDPEFPGSAGHYYYINSAKSGKGNYSAWNLTNAKGKVQAQVGDVLVRKRKPDAKNPDKAMHGDVVYEVINNEAFLAGGNVSAHELGRGRGDGQQTAKIVKIMTLKNGYYSSLRSSDSNYPYEVIIKKNAVLEDE